jgi:hypothetical protein
MPKVKISEYSATANSNTDVASINIDEGCAPSGINNAIRAIMGHLKDFQSGTSNDPFTVGSTGSLTLSYGTANGVAYLNGSKVLTTGSALVFDATNTALSVGGAALGTAANRTVFTLNGVSSNFLSFGIGGTRVAHFYSDANEFAIANAAGASGFITMQTNGAEKMRLDASGNLGLGVTPSAWLSSWKALQIGQSAAITSGGSSDAVFSCNTYLNASAQSIYLNTAAASRYYQAGGVHYWFNAPSGTAGNAITFTQAMTLDASGNLSIKPTNDGGLGLDIYRGNSGGFLNSWARITDASGVMSFQQIDTSSSAGFNWKQSSNSGSSFTTNMTLDASGNLLVGATSNSTLASAQGLYLRGTGADNATYGLNNGTTSAVVSLALFYSSYSTANQAKFEVTSDGSVKSRTNSYAGFSDARLKQGVTPASTQWNDIKNIEVVKFQMKSEQFSDEENPWMLGVIAQQVEQVSPGLVDEDVKDGMKTVKYSILYMKAVKALQEAMERIEQLETRITALEGA